MRILMTGATGLAGQGVLHELLAGDDVTRVAVLGRRAFTHPDPRVEHLLVERFDALDPVLDRLAPFDACIYCAGAPPGKASPRRHTEPQRAASTRAT